MYIGCHKTTNPNDDYIGSGIILKRAIRKYGKENFQKEVLFIFDTPVEMFSKEAEIVDRLFVESDNTYNLLEGGWGGFEYLNSTGKNLYGQNGDESHGQQNLYSGKKIKEYLTKIGKWDEYRNNMSKSLKERYSKIPFHWSGRKHKEESKRKIGLAASIAQKGEKNSQYGTRWAWISKNGEVKRIPLSSLDEYTTLGWTRGIKKI
jgi:hypothetical protein